MDTAALKPIAEMSPDEVSAELEKLMNTHNFVRPSRSNIDPARPWREGVPNYDSSDLAFFRGRSVVHPPGSLEAIVEDAVKTWEMEATHLDFKDWSAVDHDAYKVQANGGKIYEREEGPLAGNYNWLMDNCDKDLYDKDTETFESSHLKFRTAFTGGFPWEVLSVQSGPPEIAFSWRHWGIFEGQYKTRTGDGKKYDMYGWGILNVDDKLRVQQIRIFYKPNEWLKALEGKIDPRELTRGESLFGKGCPYASRNAGNANASAQ